MFLVVWLAHDHLAVLVAALVGAGYLLLIERNAATAATVLFLGVVFNIVALSVLFRIGVPASVVQAASLWKEGVVGGCLLAVLHRHAFRRPDAIDLAAGAYVALGTLYLFVAGLSHGNVGGAHLSLYDRSRGWVSDVLYVAAFLTFRHLRLGRTVVDTVFRRVLIVTVTTAVIGIFEAIFSAPWNYLAVKILGVTTYRHVVLHEHPSAAFRLDDVRVYGAHQIIRIGSVLFSYISIGFVFAIGLGIAAELVARGRTPRWIAVSMPILGVALLLTQTRSAIIAGVLATVFALRRRSGKSLAARARLARALAVVLVVVLPVIIASGALGRFSAAGRSNADHLKSLHTAVDVMTANPMGLGLSTAAGGGQVVQQEAATSTLIVSESQYLQVGTQLGFVGLILYLLLLAVLLRRLLRRDSDDPAGAAAGAMSNVAVGVLVGAIVTIP
ncbi:MAG: O-antigen ligase family protein, partial [Actinomycetota bacterium]|nr:O-antigen ligase family protein [Actinomycetota bacterium]